MKLLLDENLSFRIVPLIDSMFPGSAHVRDHSLLETDDSEIWDFAEANGFCILSKDEDFHQLAMLRGQPPKFVYLRIGNASTKDIVELIQSNAVRISHFGADPNSSVLIL